MVYLKCFEDKVSGFIYNKDNLEDLKEILVKLYKNFDYIKTISVNAKVVALNKYHPEKVADDTYGFYKKILKESFN